MLGYVLTWRRAAFLGLVLAAAGAWLAPPELARECVWLLSAYGLGAFFTQTPGLVNRLKARAAERRVHAQKTWVGVFEGDQQLGALRRSRYLDIKRACLRNVELYRDLLAQSFYLFVREVRLVFWLAPALAFWGWVACAVLSRAAVFDVMRLLDSGSPSIAAGLLVGYTFACLALAVVFAAGALVFDPVATAMFRVYRNLVALF
jgi:hypothetical protein